MATRAAGGKGSAKRPSGVSMETFDNNFDRIFGNKKQNRGQNETHFSPYTNAASNKSLSEEAEDICRRLLDSEEHAVEAAIPPIAEDAVEMIHKLQKEIEALRCKQAL